MSSKTRTKKVTSKRTKPSGDGAQSFDNKTVQEFKEAFGIMDQNKDGIICKNDLKDLYASLGQIASDSQLEEMIKEAPGPINFTTFLTLFGDRLTGTDPEDIIIGAFRMFDQKDTGFISEDQLTKIITNIRGEPLDDKEIKDMYKANAPIQGGKVDYKAFAKLITTGAQEELAQA
uniref:EF-hand domain-containing protein n=1 Tax=Trichuris muris TaxID=70415 RepID=A0A5S6QJS8_TRIMR